MAAAAPIRQQVELCIGKAGLPVGSLIYVRQGRREHSTFAYDAAWPIRNCRLSLSWTTCWRSMTLAVSVHCACAMQMGPGTGRPRKVSVARRR